jgi:hypothetical protein
MIGVELSQYMQRKPVDLIRSIISCFAVEYWLLINIGKLIIAQVVYIQDTSDIQFTSVIFTASKLIIVLQNDRNNES